MNKLQIQKAKNFITFDDYANPTKVGITKHLLSTFYNSRTTRYASCLNSSPFIIITDKEDIAKAGYSKSAKAIITLDENNEEVKKILTDVLAERIAQVKRVKEAIIQKENLTKEIAKEAGNIAIDEEFKRVVKLADTFEGLEKSKVSASALKGLLERNKIDKIKTDFWKVYRILKKSI